MERRKLGKSGIEVTTLALGTWAFGGDKWWGKQDDLSSQKTLCRAIQLGINLIDTAPVYGNGRSETIVGQTLKEENLREKVVLATKVGLRWKRPDSEDSFECLKRESILEEIEDSLRRLNTDVIDLYQVHYPDADTPIAETAQTLYKIYQKGRIKAVGVSNYDVPQMQEFMKHCPLHSLQPKYNMFRREIESETLPFCRKNNIAVIVYSSLNSGVLTGKFFFGSKVPHDRVRDVNYDLKEANFGINKETLLKLRELASKYKRGLAPFALNWITAQEGITSSIVGARRPAQIEENAGAAGWKISRKDLESIEAILKEREERIATSVEYN